MIETFAASSSTRSSIGSASGWPWFLALAITLWRARANEGGIDRKLDPLGLVGGHDLEDPAVSPRR